MSSSGAKSDISSLLTSSGAKYVMSHPLPVMSGYNAWLFYYIPNIKHWWVLWCNGSAISWFLSSLSLSVSLPLSVTGVPALAVRVACFESSARQIKNRRSRHLDLETAIYWMSCQRGAALYEGRTPIWHIYLLPICMQTHICTKYNTDAVQHILMKT